jgi:hypothetical protein
LENYLTSTSSAANWWELAYERYRQLSAEAGLEPKPEAELSSAANRRSRLVTGVTLADGTTITLNAPIAETLAAVEQSLGTDDVLRLHVKLRGSELCRAVGRGRSR